MRVRRALDLQFQSVGHYIQFHSPREGVLYKGSALQDSRLTEFLVGLKEWESEEAAADRLCRIANISPGAAHTEIRRLVEARVLVSDEDAEQVDIFNAAPLWIKYGWEDAFSYQVLSDSVRRVDYRNHDGMLQDIEMMHEYLAKAPQPPIYMQFSSGREISLPEPRKTLNSSAHDALCDEVMPVRRSAALSAENISTFLWFSLGQIGIKKTPALGDQIRRTSPSGGSRHPTEGYVLIIEPGEIPSGIYHYSVANHALEFIREPVDREWIALHVAQKPEWMAVDPTMAIILTSQVERSMYRYRENYSYRPIHHDVGHIVETSSLIAKALGIKFFRGFSMNDREVSDKLGTLRLTQPAMAFMLLG